MRQVRLAGVRGWTLTELAAVVAVAAVVASVAVSAAGPARRTAQNVSSQANLRVIGQMSVIYAAVFDGKVPTYSWKRGVEYLVDGQLSPALFSSDQEAQSWQSVDLLRRLTGRTRGHPGPIRNAESRIANKRYSHLVLEDFFGGDALSPIFVSPSDGLLSGWRRDVFAYERFPYGDNPMVPDGYDTDGNWGRSGIVQRWPYSSSYQPVPAAWMPDEPPTYGPTRDTPHLFTSYPSSADEVDLGGRRFGEVVFPAGKVFIFEEFEWQPIGRFAEPGVAVQGTYFAYPQARVNKLMFDLSVNDWQTSDANPGRNPNRPSTPWTQRYKPLDKFPAWPAGWGPGDELPQWFRWTRFGLRGIDYGPWSPDGNSAAEDAGG